MNWGKGIIVTFIIFIGIITTMVVISLRQDVGLVAPDYYKQEIAYQQQIDRMNNYNMLEEKPLITIDRSTSELALKFPESLKNSIESGEIHLFRPSHTGIDQVYKMQIDENGEQRIDISQFLKGRWKVKFYWATDPLEYFNEVAINI